MPVGLRLWPIEAGSGCSRVRKLGKSDFQAKAVNKEEKGEMLKSIRDKVFRVYCLAEQVNG